MFSVGQKVVCIKGSEDKDDMVKRIKAHHVVKGNKYKIRSITERRDGTGVLLDGIYNPNNQLTGLEYAYDVRRFSPIEEKETDISVFKEILISNKAVENA